MKKYFILFSAALFLFSCAPTAKFTYDVEKKVAPSPIKFNNQSQKAESY